MKLSLLLSLLFLSFSYAEEKSPLTIGMELSYPPFEMTNPEGKPTGISVDLAHALGAYLRRDIKIENIPFDGLIPSLKTGKIDLIISSMTATAERSKSISFSDPYLTTGLCLLVPIGSNALAPEKLNRPEMTIAVKKGTTGQLYAMRHLSKARILVIDKESSCVLEVLQGKAQAFIYDQMSVFKHAQQHPDKLKAQLNPLVKESWAIGLKLNNHDLRANINSFIYDYRKQGGFEKLGDTYLKEQKDAFKAQGIEFVF